MKEYKQIKRRTIFCMVRRLTIDAHNVCENDDSYLGYAVCSQSMENRKSGLENFER